MKYPGLRFQKAFSVIELLLAMATIGIVVLLVVPGWRDVIERNRANVFVSKLSASLRFTRASAIKLGKRVIFCGSQSGKACDGTWEQGQIIITESGELLQILPKIFVGDKFIWLGSAAANKNKVIFSPDGYFNGQRGHFHYCPSGSSDNAMGLVLEKTGRLRVVKPHIL